MTRVKSDLEEGVVAVLSKARSPLPLTEILRRMEDYGCTMPAGKTPSRSLYSTLFRRERRRKEAGVPALFKWQVASDRVLHLSLARGN